MDPCDLSPPTTHWQTLVGEGQENMPPIAADSIAVDVARSDVRKGRAAPMELERQECKRFRRTLGVLRASDASTPGSSTLPSTPADLKSLSTEIRAEMQASVAELKRDMNELKKLFKKEFTDLKKDVKKEMADMKKEMKTETTELKEDIEEVSTCIDALHTHVKVAAQDIQAIKTAMGRMADSLAPMRS
jgi:chromosome segregation ATPase